MMHFWALAPVLDGKYLGSSLVAIAGTAAKAVFDELSELLEN